MEEDLPSEFDLIVLGTGMPESVLAAAAARCGKSVLHLDQNDFYGDNWASFNFDNLQRWAKSHTEPDKEEPSSQNNPSLLVKENETVILFTPKIRTTFGVSVHEFVSQSTEVNKNTSSSDAKQTSILDNTSGENNEKSKSDAEQQESSVCETDSQTISSDNTKNEDVKIESADHNKLENKTWSIEEMVKNNRKFNLDLAPKLLFSRGALVELLIQSNISRYAEFKCSSQILTLLDGSLMPVPCSRADVFSTKHVSIVEKRMLMKLLKFCLEFEDHPEEFKEYENKPFVKFLNSKKLTKNVEHYLIHSIAMVDPDHPTLDSLKRVQKFLQSLGRYGNSPFLFPLYGSGEIPQCFCRLCAVFGGVYCLKRKVDALILNDKCECVAAVANNKRIDCKFFAMECSYAPKDYLPNNFFDREVSRALYITDAPIYPTEHDDLTFLCLPSCEAFQNAVSILELGPSSNVCPSGLKVVHMSCMSGKETSREDLLPAAQMLFNMNEANEFENSSQKPNVLWAMYFNRYDNSWLDLNKNAPGNVFLLPTPDIEQDYEMAIGKAKEAFLKMFPTEEFLPRAPEPEEIVMDEPEVPENNSSGEEKLNKEETEVAVESKTCEEATEQSVESKTCEEATELTVESKTCEEATGLTVESKICEEPEIIDERKEIYESKEEKPTDGGEK